LQKCSSALSTHQKPAVAIKSSSIGLIVAKSRLMFCLNQHTKINRLIDTVLLFSGISLAIILHQYPGTQTWLTAKLLALLAYIIMGNIAIKRGKTKTSCLIAWIAALAIFFYIVTVALTRVINPLAW
jgi:uncharacterized membrane protein SirB2